MNLIKLNKSDLEKIIEISISSHKIKSKVSPLQKDDQIIGHELLFELPFKYKDDNDKFKYSYYNPVLEKEIPIKGKLDLLDALKYNKLINKITLFHISQARELYNNSEKKNEIYYSINIGPVEMESLEFQQELLKIAKNEPSFFKTLQFEILEDPAICLQDEYIQEINGIKIHECKVEEYKEKHENTIKFLSLVKRLGAKITLDDVDARLLEINRIEDLINILKNLPQGEIKELNNGKLDYVFLRDKNDEIITKNELGKFTVKLDKTVTQALTVHDYLIKKYQYKEGTILEKDFLLSKIDFDRIKNAKYKDLEKKVDEVVNNKLHKDSLRLSPADSDLFDFLIVEKIYKDIEKEYGIDIENNSHSKIKEFSTLNLIQSLTTTEISEENSKLLLEKIIEDTQNIKDKFIENHLIQSLFQPISKILRENPINDLDIEGPIDPSMIRLIEILNNNIGLENLSELTLEFVETEQQAKNIKEILKLYALDVNNISIIFQGDVVQHYNENYNINSNINNFSSNSCPIKKLEDDSRKKKIEKEKNNIKNEDDDFGFN